MFTKWSQFLILSPSLLGAKTEHPREDYNYSRNTVVKTTHIVYLSLTQRDVIIKWQSYMVSTILSCIQNNVILERCHLGRHYPCRSRLPSCQPCAWSMQEDQIVLPARHSWPLTKCSCSHWLTCLFYFRPLWKLRSFLKDGHWLCCPLTSMWPNVPHKGSERKFLKCSKQ